MTELYGCIFSFYSLLSPFTVCISIYGLQCLKNTVLLVRKSLILLFFVKDRSTAYTSTTKLYSVCYIYREKLRLKRKRTNTNLIPTTLPRSVTPLLGPFLQSTTTINPPPLITDPRMPPPSFTNLQMPPPPVTDPQMPPPPVFGPEPSPGFLPSDQWKLRETFYEELDKIKMETCLRCKERWFNMRLQAEICYNCRLRDASPKDTDRNTDRNTVFLMSQENNMDPGEVPAFLPQLL